MNASMNRSMGNASANRSMANTSNLQDSDF
jgi:hypothetical protein